ncbi:MAG: RDD family protein, partial [Acidobacteriota bacterium]
MRKTEPFQASAVEISTPEGVTFSLPLAGPVSRLLALAIDGSIIFTAITAISFAAGGVVSALGDYLIAAQLLLYFTVQIGYGLSLEWFWNGRTVGKRALGLRVVDAQGLRLEFSQALIRNLLRAVDSLPLFYLLGGMVCVLNPRLQRLGDLAAGTIVVRTRRLKLPALPAGQGVR